MEKYVQCDSICVKQPATKSGQIPIKLTRVAPGWNWVGIKRNF